MGIKKQNSLELSTAQKQANEKKWDLDLLPFPTDLCKTNSIDTTNQTVKQIRMSIFCLPWHKNCWTEGKKSKLSLALSAVSWGLVLPSSKGCHCLLCSLVQLFLHSFSNGLNRPCRNAGTDHRKFFSAHELTGPKCREQPVCLSYFKIFIFLPKASLRSWVTENCRSSTLTTCAHSIKEPADNINRQQHFKRRENQILLEQSFEHIVND